jgi:hypothetical protein
MTHIRWFLLFLLALSGMAHADDVAYAPGSRVGLVLPHGITVSKRFQGFEDASRSVAIIVGVLPAAAFPQYEKSDSIEGLKNIGVTLEKRETLTLPTGKALLVIGRKANLSTWMLVAQTPDLTATITAQVPDAAKDTYPDQVLHAAFESLAVRDQVPVAEQLALVPFKLANLADFKISAVLPGRGIILSDKGSQAALTPHVVAALMPGGPAEPSDREQLALQMFRGIPDLADIHITAAQALRIGGLPGYEIMATAKEPTSGTELSMVQWLRFGSGAFLHMVGIAPTNAWTPAYGRFRQVRDGIE